MAGTSSVGQGVTPLSWVKRSREQTPQPSKRLMRVGQVSLQCPLKPLGLIVKQQTCATTLLKKNGAKSSDRSAAAVHVSILSECRAATGVFLENYGPTEPTKRQQGRTRS